MPEYKCTFFFELAKYGWSETWFRQEATPDAALASSKVLAAQRASLLASPAQLSAVRISDESIQRDSLFFEWTGNALEGGNTFGNSDIPNTAALLRIEAGSLYRRNLYLRGIPDSFVTEPNGLVLDPAWNKNFQGYRSLLINSQWHLKAIQKTPPPPTQFITGAARGANGTWTVTLQNQLPGISNGSRIRISKTQGVPRLNGYWLVYPDPLGAALIYLLNSGGIYGNWTGGGYAALLSPSYNPVTNVIVERATHRITGRPFDEPRGQRRRVLRSRP